MKKVFIQTHGCQMNEYDSAKMLELLGEKSNFQTTENATGMSVRQTIKLKEGISKENAKKINTLIKNLKFKVQSQIQGEQLRVTGKKIDDLQNIIETIKKSNLDIHLDFVNFKK